MNGKVVPHGAEVALDIHEPLEADDCQQVVGGWIQATDVPSLGVMVFVNEAGRLQHMSANSRMTFLPPDFEFEVEEIVVDASRA